MKPRDYQNYATAEALRFYFSDERGNPVVVLPTGTGKSIVIALVVKGILQGQPGARILKLTHVKELIKQNFEKLLAIFPTCPAGIYSAGLRRKDTGRQVTFAGIGSVAKKAALFGHIDAVIVDECHTISPKANSNYRRFIDDLRSVNPKLKVIGLTATDYRLGQGQLTDPGGIFTHVVVNAAGVTPFNWFISEGYLSRLVPRATTEELDVSAVGIRGGEFVQSDLQAAVDKEEITQAALDEAATLGKDRSHWLIFTTGVKHCGHVVELLERMGISAVAVHSKMTTADRDEALALFTSGKVRAAVNNNVLTTGFDFPGIDLIVMLRPTSSPGLWVQMLGRGTRPVYAPGFDLSTREGRVAAIAAGPKPNCLVLDFAGNTKRLGPINDPVKPKPRGKKGKGAPPFRLCPECMTYNHTRAVHCVECGFVFPVNERIAETAGKAALVREPVAPIVETFHVKQVAYSKHVPRDSRPPSLKVTYQCEGLRSFTEWVCLEHEGFAGKRARDWFRERTGGEEPPETIDNALRMTSKLDWPKLLFVWVNREPSPQINGYEF